MKRNWDVIRKVLVRVEEEPDESGNLNSECFDGISPEVAVYHIRLLIEAGLLVGSCPETTGVPWCHLQRMTWAGHEFLDAIRRDTVWNRVREIARDRGIDLSFEVIKVLAVKAIERLL